MIFGIFIKNFSLDNEIKDILHSKLDIQHKNIKIEKITDKVSAVLIHDFSIIYKDLVDEANKVVYILDWRLYEGDFDLNIDKTYWEDEFKNIDILLKEKKCPMYFKGKNGKCLTDCDIKCIYNKNLEENNE